jgi:hypothetical protein
MAKALGKMSISSATALRKRVKTTASNLHDSCWELAELLYEVDVAHPSLDAVGLRGLRRLLRS